MAVAAAEGGMHQPPQNLLDPPLSASEARSHPMYFPGLVGFRTDAANVKYWIGEMLSRGSYGEAWTLIRAQDSATFAGKVMLLDGLSSKQQLRARSEVACINAVAGHFGIVNYVESCEQNNKLLIVMEYCDAGDLSFQIDYRRRCGQRFDEAEIKKILLQLVLSLNHLHSKRVLHRDLKPKNILISTSGIVKIGDFGLSQSYEASLTDVAETFCGTPLYISPEIWLEKKYGRHADMWALGCVLYEMMMLRAPFASQNWQTLRHMVTNGQYALVEPSTYSPELVQIQRLCMRVDPTKRIDTNGLLAMPYIRQALDELHSAVVMSRERMSDELFAMVVHGIEGIKDRLGQRGTAALAAVLEQEDTPANIENLPSSRVPTDRAVDFGKVVMEGPVRKFKDGQFVDRYMVMNDINMFIVPRAGAPITTNCRPLPLSSVHRVMEIPAAHANGVPHVFSVQEAAVSYWFQAPDAEAACLWVQHISSHLMC